MATTIELQYTTKTSDKGKQEAFKKIEGIADAVNQLVSNKESSQGFVTVCKDVLRAPDRNADIASISHGTDQFSRVLLAAMAAAVDVPEHDMGDTADGKKLLKAVTTKVNVDKIKALLATVDPTPAVDTTDLVTAIADLDPAVVVDTTALNTTTDQGVLNLTTIVNKAKTSKDEEAANNVRAQEMLINEYNEKGALKGELDSKNELMEQKDELLAQKEQLIVQNDKMIEALKGELASKNELMEQKDELLAQKEAAIEEKEAAIEELQGELASKNELMEQKDELLAQKEQLIVQKDTENQTLAQKLAQVTGEHEKMLEAMRNAPDGSPARAFADSFMASPPGNGRKRALEEFLDAKQIEFISEQVTDGVKRTNAFDEPIEGIGADVFSKLNPKEMRNANKTLRSFFKTTDGAILQVDFNPTNEHIMVFTVGGVLPDPEHFKNTLAECIKAAATGSASAADAE